MGQQSVERAPVVYMSKELKAELKGAANGTGNRATKADPSATSREGTMPNSSESTKQPAFGLMRARADQTVQEAILDGIREYNPGESEDEAQADSTGKAIDADMIQEAVRFYVGGALPGDDEPQPEVNTGRGRRRRTTRQERNQRSQGAAQAKPKSQKPQGKAQAKSKPQGNRRNGTAQAKPWRKRVAEFTHLHLGDEIVTISSVGRLSLKNTVTVGDYAFLTQVSVAPDESRPSGVGFRARTSLRPEGANWGAWLNGDGDNGVLKTILKWVEGKHKGEDDVFFRGADAFEVEDEEGRYGVMLVVYHPDVTGVR